MYMDERINDLPEWAKKKIIQQEKEIDALKKAINKICVHNEAITQVYVKLNVGAKNG